MATKKSSKKNPLASTKAGTCSVAGKLNSPASIPKTHLAAPVQSGNVKIPAPKAGSSKEKEIKVPVTPGDLKINKEGKKPKKQLGKKENRKKKVKKDLKNAKNKQKKIKKALKKAKSGKTGKKKVKKMKLLYAKASKKVKKIKKG